MEKTNAMRALDKNKIAYNSYSYDAKDGKVDGVSVANKIGKEVGAVFKTLVNQGASKEFYIFVVPVAEELDLKKAAKVVGEKRIEMINPKDLLKTTGYIKGGCSPIGMKKLYKTVIDESALAYENIIVSAGKIGSQIEINPNDLATLIRGQFEPICVDRG